MTAFRDFVILIPQHGSAHIVDPACCEPPNDDAGDSWVLGDHDMHSSWKVGEWLDNPELHNYQKNGVNSQIEKLRKRMKHV